MTKTQKIIFGVAILVLLFLVLAAIAKNRGAEISKRKNFLPIDNREISEENSVSPSLKENSQAEKNTPATSEVKNVSSSPDAQKLEQEIDTLEKSLSNDLNLIQGLNFDESVNF